MAKRVIIAGVAGTGNALATRLVNKGHNVHIIGRNATRVGELAAALGPRATSAVCDVLQHEAWSQTLASAAAAGPVHGFVYAVGSIPLKPLKATSAADFSDAWTLNFLGAALGLKALTPALAEAQGSALFFSTVAARVGFPNHTAIAAAKGALEAFTRSAAAELAPKIRVNAIAPSLTDTALASRLLPNDAMRKALGDAHPIPRVGTAGDLAAVAEMLLALDAGGEGGGWMTGQVISVDGGRSTLRHKN